MVNSVLSTELFSLIKRNNCPPEGCPAMPVSTWEKTGIPVLISLVLFAVVFAVLFFIIRRKRQQTKKDEEAAQQKIDMDDVEERAAFRASSKK